VIGGPTGQAQAPHRAGATIVGSATNKGKFLIRLDAGAEPKSPWAGEVVEVGASLLDDPVQQQNLASYLATLRRMDYPASQTGLVRPLENPPKDFAVAGSDSCMACHHAEHAQWKTTAHAHAGATLAKKGGFDAEPYCLQCHTTGFAMPRGFESPNLSPSLMAVGCESCHGPSQAHVRQPTVRTPYAAFDQCVRCHDQENSPRFDRATYWAKIEHGKKPATAGATP
jgi:hypothetical protein